MDRPAVVSASLLRYIKIWPHLHIFEEESSRLKASTFSVICRHISSALKWSSGIVFNCRHGTSSMM